MPKNWNESKNLDSIRVAAVLSLLAGTPAALAQELPTLEDLGLPADLGQGTQPGEDGVSTGHVAVDQYEQIELHFRDEDIATALQLLAMQSQRSIVTTQRVSGTVTANLYGVSFGEALDAILLYNGFGYIEQGGTIYVMPKEDILAWEQSQRKMETAVIRLNYLNAVDAAQFVQAVLSPDGSITTNGVTPEFTINDSAPVGKDDYSLESVLVVRDFPEQVQEIRELVAQLDTRPVSVLVEATILQKSISDAYGYGVDFSILSNLEFLEFVGAGGPLGVVDSLIRGEKALSGGDGGEGGGTAPLPTDGGGTGITQTVGNTSGPGGLKIGVVSNDVAAFVRLLDEMGDTTILSNPKLMTLNRQPASVQVGRRIGYLSTTTTDTTTQQTVEFLDTGTQLYFRPFATAGGDIRLELRPEVSQPIIRSVTDATGAAVTVPDEDTSQLSTNVLVRDGQTVVLGGLFTERTTSSRRQVPGLGDVPLLGMAFRGEDNTVDRAEIIFLITPSIVEDESMADAGVRAIEEVDFARSGAREGLLFWSRERRASQLLVDAQRLSAEGNTREALNKVQRALALQPTMTDGIRLREQLVREPNIWPSRSGLQEVVNRETDARIDMFREAIAARTASAGTPSNAKSARSMTFADENDAFESEFAGHNAAESGTPDHSGTDYAGDGGFGSDQSGAVQIQDGSIGFNDAGQSDASDLAGHAGDPNHNSADGGSSSVNASDAGWWQSDLGAAGMSPGDSMPNSGWAFSGHNAQAASSAEIEGTLEEQWQLRSAYLGLTNEQLQRTIEQFADAHARFPTLEELARAPSNGKGSSFGGLIDAGLLSEQPVNPFFPSASASTVGKIGSGLAFEYDPATGTMVANVGDFSSVFESGDLAPVSATTLALMTQRTIQQQIDAFFRLTGRAPTLPELAGAPSFGGQGPTFGVLVDEGLMTAAPRNPLFVGEHAFSVGAPGDDAAWIYDEASRTITARTNQYAGAGEDSGNDD